MLEDLLDFFRLEIGNALTLPKNQLYQGDCIELLSSLDAGLVDLVFADPPFNIGYKYDVYDDKKQEEDYLDWSRKWIGQIHRVLKPDGTFWLAIGDEYAAELKIEAKKIGFHCRSWVIWYYTFGVNCVNGFSRSHTHLFHFTKDTSRFTFNRLNPQIRVQSARQLVYADARANPNGRLPDNTWITRPQDAPKVLVQATILGTLLELLAPSKSEKVFMGAKCQSNSWLGSSAHRATLKTLC